MRFARKTNVIHLLLLLLLAIASPAFAQDAGEEDLEAAFDLKPKAELLKDFDKIVKLCKSAIKKGLDEEGETEAKLLAASVLFEQAEQLMIRISRGERDPAFYRDQAVKLLKESVEFDPEMGEGWLMIANLNALRGGDVDEAREAIDQAIEKLEKLPGKQSEAYLLRSMMTQKDDRDTARKDLDRAIELDESNVRALRARSTLLIIEGSVAEGLEDVDTLLELSEGKVNALLAQAEILSRMADAKTVAVARKILAEDSEEGSEDQADDSDLPDQSVEQLEADAKRIRESVLGIYGNLVELSPEKEEFYLLKARTHRALDQDEEALAVIDKLIEKDDRSIAALREKARMLLVEEDNDDETIKILDQAIEIDPYDTETRSLRMQFFTAREQFDNAIVEAEKIVEKQPNNSVVMDRLALLYSFNEQPKKAIEVYDGLLSRMPMRLLDELPPRSRPIFLAQKIGTLSSRANAYLSTGEHEFAIEDYEEAIDLGEQIEEMQASLQDNSFEYTPDDGVLNNLAWVLATSTADELRDGKRAIELATLACEVTEYKQPHIMSTLASGYAEDGDFDAAIKWIEKGLEVNAARDTSDFITEAEIKRQRESLEKELDSYKQKKPWRENQAEENAKKKEAAAKKADEDEEDSDEEDSDEEDSDDEDSDDEDSDDEDSDDEDSDDEDSDDEDSDDEDALKS